MKSSIKNSILGVVGGGGAPKQNPKLGFNTAKKKKNNNIGIAIST